MLQLNRIQIVGALAADPKLTEGAPGRLVEVDLKTVEASSIAGGGRVENFSLHALEFRDRMADLVLRAGRKDVEIYIDGALKTSVVTDSAGKEHKACVIQVKSLQLFDLSRAPAARNDAGAPAGQVEPAMAPAKPSTPVAVETNASAVTTAPVEPSPGVDAEALGEPSSDLAPSASEAPIHSAVTSPPAPAVAPAPTGGLPARRTFSRPGAQQSTESPSTARNAGQAPTAAPAVAPSAAPASASSPAPRRAFVRPGVQGAAPAPASSPAAAVKPLASDPAPVSASPVAASSAGARHFRRPGVAGAAVATAPMPAPAPAPAAAVQTTPDPRRTWGRGITRAAAAATA